MSIADAGDTYSIQKVELLKFGGNDRFKNFLESFISHDESSPSYNKSVFEGWPISKKYSTNAVKYYRHKIQMLAKQETPQMDCPDLEVAQVIIEDDIEDWIFIADDDFCNQKQDQKHEQSENEVHQSSVKEFLQERKDDLKLIKAEVKNVFGKVSSVFKKKKEVDPPEEHKKSEPPAQPVKDKPSGFKVFGSKVKMGFSKIFSKKD